MVKKFGAIFSPIDQRDYSIVKFSPEMLDKNDPLPEVEALYKQQHIDNQGNTSMCAAYTFVNKMTIRIFKRTGDYMLLSPAAFYADEDNRTYKGEGMMGRDVMQIARKTGVLRREALPLESGTYEQCVDAFNSNKLSCKEQAVAYRTDGFARLNDAYELAQYIFQEEIGTWIAFNVYENIRNAQYTGIIEQPSGAFLGGHAVLAEGIVYRSGQPYIKFVNTWGFNWGDGGCGYLPANMLRESWGEYDRPPLAVDNEPHEIIFFLRDIDDEMNTRTILTDCPNVQISDHPDAYTDGSKIIVRNGVAAAYVENRLMSIVRPLWEAVGWQVDWYGDYVILTRGKTESQFKKELGI